MLRMSGEEEWGRRKVGTLSHHVWHIPGALLRTDQQAEGTAVCRWNKRGGTTVAPKFRSLTLRSWDDQEQPAVRSVDTQGRLNCTHLKCTSFQPVCCTNVAHTVSWTRMLHECCTYGFLIRNLRLRSAEVAPQLWSTAGAPVRWQAQVCWGTYGIYTLRYGQNKSCGCTIVTLYSFQYLMCMYVTTMYTCSMTCANRLDSTVACTSTFEL